MQTVTISRGSFKQIAYRAAWFEAVKGKIPKQVAAMQDRIKEDEVYVELNKLLEDNGIKEAYYGN